jgi:hypothetical protein
VGHRYYRAHDGSVPVDDFLDGCPTNVEAKLLAVLEVVRAAPPPAFSGGGKWEAMHGSMGGCYEVRTTGPGREHFRLFCRLENGTQEELAQLGFDRPHIVVINGMRKRNARLFSDAEYRKRVRDLGDAYVADVPRSIAV